MGRLRIVHTTGYVYQSPVTASYNEARLTPRSDSRQNVILNRVETVPATRSYRYIDYWGTAVTAFDLHAPHTELTVTSSSVVETEPPESPATKATWSDLRFESVIDRFDELVRPTAHTPTAKAVSSVGKKIARTHGPADAVVAAADWVRGELNYLPGTTSVQSSGLDALSVSSHKVGGPLGVGALIAARGLTLEPLLHGGSQERNRSGTLDVPGIAGFAAALTTTEDRRVETVQRVGELRDALAEGIGREIPDAVYTGDPRPEGRLPGNAHFSFPGCEGDALLMLLDARGIECSTGSACTAGIPEPSHVLLAMGVDPELARGSLRFSLGSPSTMADVDAVLDALPSAVERARRAGQPRVRPPA